MSLLRVQRFLPSRPTFRASYIRPRPIYQSRFQSTSPQSRIDRVLSRVPKPLQRYTNGLRNAPVSHVVSFLILHEITAVVPLVGLACLFHYMEWLPKEWAEAKYVSDGIAKYGRYFRRKGWFGFDKENPVEEIHLEGKNLDTVAAGGGTGANQAGVMILLEVATAYAVMKILMPARIILSVWATPWFARVALDRLSWISRRLRRR